MSLVSIIVPIYNVETYIGKCLKSLVNQTYEDIEIVLIDDGSEDHSCDIAKEYVQKYHNVHLFSYSNAGVSMARNRGLQMAKGKYVMFMDSDDYLDKKAIEVMVHYMEANDCDLVTCGYVIDYPFGRFYRKGCKTGTMTSIEALDSLARGTGINNYPWAKLYKKELFDEIEFPVNIQRFEDAYTIFKTMIKAKRIGNVSKRYYHYMQHAGSLTNHMNIEMVYQMRDSVEYQDMYLKKAYPKETFHFDQQYFNADMMILYTMLRQKNHAKYMPATIDWEQIHPIYHMAYLIWRKYVLWRLGYSARTQEDFGH